MEKGRGKRQKMTELLYLIQNKRTPFQWKECTCFALFPPCAGLCLVAQPCLTLSTPWTVAHQAPLSVGILQARILEWVALHSSRGSSQPQDRTCISFVSCCGRWVLYHQHHLKPTINYPLRKK